MENPFEIFDERLTRIEETQVEILKRLSTKPVEDDELLTTTQLMKLAKVSRMTILRWRKDGKLSPVLLGKSVRFRKSDLLNMKKGA